MEENKLNTDELKQVSGGAKGSFNDPAVIIKTTPYFSDKNLQHLKQGAFVVGEKVWVNQYEDGACGKVFFVQSRKNSSKKGYIPGDTVKHDYDE